MEELALVLFCDTYKGKKVIVTGHTGFKGTWLTSWLLRLGAKVAGISNGIPTNPSMFEDLDLYDEIEHNVCDICDFDSVLSVIADFKPDFVFHLAAQSLVSRSYQSPLETINTNVIGTSVVIDCLRRLGRKCSLILITSDKCYDNVEWLWGYKEADPLGGKDIYSASKAAAELVISAFYESFARNSGLKMASTRAGNVIGGGDWAKDRVVVDCIKSWLNSEAVIIRNPDSTRPWQHVLEPLSGYLLLGERLSREDDLVNGESFNFGPSMGETHSVRELIGDISREWGFEEDSKAMKIKLDRPFGEATLLKLNCEKSKSMLNWSPTLHYKECVSMVVEWYLVYARSKFDLKSKTLDQITLYEKLAKERNQAWAM